MRIEPSKEVNYFLYNLGRIFVPFGIAFSVLLALSIFHGFEIMPKLMSVYGFYSLPFIDILPAFALGLGLGVHYLTVSLWLFAAETCEALFVAWNFDHLYRFNWFKRKVKQSRMKVFEKYIWFFDFRFIGVIFITIIPVAAAGAIIAPIVGRILGLSVKHTILAVMIGSALRFLFFILLIKGFFAVF